MAKANIDIIANLEKQFKVAIKEANALFNKASKEEKAILLAEDVIAQVKAERYEATQGAWCNIYIDDNYDEQFNSFKVQASMPSCEVCGLGSLFCSLVKVKNNITVGDLDGISEEDIIERLGKIFSIEELSAIEIAFEQNDGFAGVGLFDQGFEDEEEKYRLLNDRIFIKSIDGKNFKDSTYKYLKAAEKFSLNIDDDKECLIKIMQNIIKNNGHFKPNDVYYL